MLYRHCFCCHMMTKRLQSARPVQALDFTIHNSRHNFNRRRRRIVDRGQGEEESQALSNGEKYVNKPQLNLTDSLTPLQDKFCGHLPGVQETLVSSAASLGRVSQKRQNHQTKRVLSLFNTDLIFFVKSRALFVDNDDAVGFETLLCCLQDELVVHVEKRKPGRNFVQQLHRKEQQQRRSRGRWRRFSKRCNVLQLTAQQWRT